MLVPTFLDALGERLATIDGLNVSTNPGATVVPPMAVVTDGEISYHEAMVPRGLYKIEFNVTVYVSKSDNDAGLLEIRKFRSNHGDHTIAGAIETSLGTSDALNEQGTVIVNTSTAGVVTRPSGETWHAVVFEGTAYIPGA